MNEAGALLESLWREVDHNWDNSRAHEALLTRCREPRQLAELATRYRRARDLPERQAIAEKQLRTIAALAMAQLEVPERREASGRIFKVVLALLLLAGSVSLAFLL